MVGEGANLGFTQAGRIDYARAGGRIDTDAIDNSAGVDTSDHEVNIKILTGIAERTGELTRKRATRLLASMTDEVAEHVLAHNYDQTLALSLMEMDAVERAGAAGPVHGRAGDRGRLDRKVEGLPGPAAIAELAAGGQGPDPAGAGGAAGLRQAGAEPRHRRQPRARRSDYFEAGWRPISPSRCRKYEAEDGAPPAAPRDHRHGGRQRGCRAEGVSVVAPSVGVNHLERGESRCPATT